MQVLFNGAAAEESKSGMNLNISASAFGDGNKQAVNNLKARVCGNEPPMDAGESTLGW